MLEEIALGRMGMHVNDFYELTPRQFSNKLKGFTESENFKDRAAWERMRFSTTALINIQLEKKDKIRPEQLCKFEWDSEKAKPAPMTDEQFIAAFSIKQRTTNNKQQTS